MAKYLVIAHQTADSYELAEALQKRVKADSSAEFTLLVPITYAGFLVLPEQGDDQRVVARARRVGEAAAFSLNEAGVNVNRVIVGDEIPVIAMEEELIDRSTDYSEIIFCTFPESISRWIRLDQLRQAEERYGMPVHHVIAVPQVSDDVELN
jgi:hypothetical protein